MLYDKSRIKSLCQCLDKSALNLHMESDADHIILIRFRSNTYYWAKDDVRVREYTRSVIGE